MKQERAIALAIKAIEAQIKRLAVQANLHTRYGSDAPMCVEASRQRQELREALELLRLPAQIKAARKAASAATQQQELSI